jgi:general secretion pathway protein I
MRAERGGGFTLIEVLVALLILSLALIALSRTAATQVQAFGDMRERTLAGWLAEDVLAETRLAARFPATGRTDGSRRFAGREWRWELNVQATEIASIRHLDVRVFPGNEREVPLAELDGFASDDLQP